MLYLSIHLIHIFSVFIYGGFLFTDNLFLSKMKKDLKEDEHIIIREYFMKYVRVVVPKALTRTSVFRSVLIFSDLKNHEQTVL